MRISIVFTDLDGTLLELDGRICHEAQKILRQVRAAGIPVCPLSSKTAAELVPLLHNLGLRSLAAFENGAGILFPGGSSQLFDRAVPVSVLSDIAANLRRETGVPLRTLFELSDQELREITGLPSENLPDVRKRSATVPLLVDPVWDATLAEALPSDRDVSLVRGNRFLQLQGRHDKGTAVNRMLTAVTRPPGVVVACGDSPNDIPMLAAAELPVVIPSADGPHASLVEQFPGALVAPFPHGRGWAATLSFLLNGAGHERRNPS